MTQEAAELNLRILWSLARWIEDTKGSSTLAATASSAGLAAHDLDGATRWSSHVKFESFLRVARELAVDDDEFKAACAHRFAESYGPMRYMLWALTPLAICEMVAKHSELVSRTGKFTIIEKGPTLCRVRYTPDRAESRLMCLSRQVGWERGPTMWGMPAAILTEHACVAHGDDHCEYHLRWYVKRRVLTPIAGGIIGALLAVAWVTLKVPVLPTVLTLPILGLALGWVYELQRTNRENIRVGHEINDVLREVSYSEAEARVELVALHNRQRDWLRIVEEQIAERTKSLENVVHGMEHVQHSRATSLRGFSHDLRNPLFVLKGNSRFLLDLLKDGEVAEAVRDIDDATTQIEKMLTMLMEVVTADPGILRMNPQELPVAPLTDTFRRRLKALVYGRDVKVSVFSTREAPDLVEIDPIILDRVVDNLLTNAAKYTPRGSIILEVGGTPNVQANDGSSFLTLKLSDTGQGIKDDGLYRIFQPRAASEERDARSYGVGLSSVVKLLAQLGGRLDVMSKPNVGTTFWAHFPARAQTVKPVADDNLESMITRVVTIRKAESA